MDYNYESCESQIVINADNDMTPGGSGIIIDILDLIQRTYKSFGKEPPTRFPEHSKMYYYGMPPEEQIFVRETIPVRLISLEKHLRQKEKNIIKREQTSIKIELNIINGFWKELELHQDDYKEEILWIEKMWYHRCYGAWYLINGKPIYFSPSYFFYVNFSSIPKARIVEYRDRDRRFGIAYNWSILETRTFKLFDKDGVALPNEFGEYEMVDLGKRVFYGMISCKPRRVGDTSKSAAFCLELATRSLENHFGLQGESENSSEKIFIEHIMFQFKKYPVFFKPLFKSVDPKEKLEFFSDDPETTLSSWVDFATSAKDVHYDGSGLTYYVGDEVGKLENVDIVKRTDTVKLALSERDRIDGIMLYASTVELMSRESGINFLKLCKQSKYHQRSGNGQTLSGLLCVNFRAQDGHPDFLDPYGYSIADFPTPKQQEYLKAKGMNPKVGADQYLQNMLIGADEEKRSQLKRQSPRCFRDVFTPPASSNIFPNERIESRITELRFGKTLTRRFDLAWVSDFGGKVGIIYKEEGHFVASYIPTPDEANRWKIIGGVQYPENQDKFIASADTFKLDNPTGNRYSKGGIGLRLRRDHSIDKDDVTVTKWRTAKQIVYYSHKPDTVNEFCEDMLKLCILYGSLAYNENNLNNVNEYFTAHGFDGYLLYPLDQNGIYKTVAGYFANLTTKQQGFNLCRDDLNMHVERMELEELLVECISILGVTDLTNFDAMSAYLGCLLAEKELAGNGYHNNVESKFNISEFYIERTY